MHAMKTKLAKWILVVAILAGVTALNLFFHPSTLTASELKLQDRAKQALEKADQEVAKSKAAETQLAQAQPAPAPAPEAAKPQPPAAAVPAAAAPAEQKDGEWPAEAPATFRVQFECTSGTFVMECNKAWAPIGVQRFYDLVREGFYDGAAFFRVVPGFVVQFGLAADPKATAKWRVKQLKDDPVTQSNKEGYICFATSGPNTRTSQVFISLADNARLDGMGFAPFGKVIAGMDVVRKITPKYGEQPNQGQITMNGAEYLKKNFPEMDGIKKATLQK
jgi:peptidyl-prolyl cis-trans isomerase A (cyclophilin A)